MFKVIQLVGQHWAKAVDTEAMQAPPCPHSCASPHGPLTSSPCSAAPCPRGPSCHCCRGPFPADLECGPQGFPELVAVRPGVRGGLQAAAGLLGGRDLRRIGPPRPPGPGPAVQHLLQQLLSPCRMPPPSTPPPPRPSWGQSTSCPAAPTSPACAPCWVQARGSRDGPASGARRFAGTPSQVTEPSGVLPLCAEGSSLQPGQQESCSPPCGVPPAFRAMCLGSLPWAPTPTPHCDCRRSDSILAALCPHVCTLSGQ